MEYRNDEILARAGEILAEERLARFEEYNGEEPGHVFSRRFERKRKKLFSRGNGRGAGRTAPRRWSMRTAVCVAALAFLSVAVIAAGPVYDRVFRTRTTAEEMENGLFLLSVERNEDAEFIERGGVPTYIPEGYETVFSGTEQDVVHQILYRRRDGCYSDIHFERTLWESGTIGYGDDDRRAVVRTEPIQIGPYEGIIQYVKWADSSVGESAYILWSDSVYMYTLNAIVTEPPEDTTLEYIPIPVPVDELVKMAQSVSKDPVAAADWNALGGWPRYLPEGYTTVSFSSGGAPHHAKDRDLLSGEWDGEASAAVYGCLGENRTEILLVRSLTDGAYPVRLPDTVDAAPEPIQIGDAEGVLLRWTDTTTGALSVRGDDGEWTILDEPTDVITHAMLAWSDGLSLYNLIAVVEAEGENPVEPLPLEELVKIAASTLRNPAPPQDFLPEAGGLPPVTEGLCPRCGEAEIVRVCGGDPVLGEDGERYTVEAPCGDPDHPEDCRTRTEYCWNDYACPNPQCGYHVSGEEFHPETVTHTSIGEAARACAWEENG